MMRHTLWNLIYLTIVAKWGSCTIAGLSYMDSIVQRSLDGDKKFPPGEDPCNPLYWYPKHIPEECNEKTTLAPPSPPPSRPLPVPIPVPAPPSLPIPYPAPVPVPRPLPVPIPPVPMPSMLLPFPAPIPVPPIPYGIPIQPTNPMLPLASPYLVPYGPVSSPYGPPPMHYGPPRFAYGSPSMSYAPPYSLGPMYRRDPVGMMPGIPGLVSPDGGINIVPFSDSYSDLLEKHKQNMLRKEMEKLIDKYDNKYTYRKRHGRHNLFD